MSSAVGRIVMATAQERGSLLLGSCPTGDFGQNCIKELNSCWESQVSHRAGEG